MGCYLVRFCGSGGVILERPGVLRRPVLRRMGFYTTRFVNADNEAEAVEKGMTLVRAEADPLTQPDAPWKITLDALEEVDPSMMREVRGFTFFREDSNR